MTRSSALLLALATLTTTIPACVDEGEILTDEAVLPDDDGGKADSAGELRVRAGDTTLWVDSTIVRRPGDGADWLVLEGRTSRNLTDGHGFVFDDPYGAFGLRGARSFDLRWSTSELSSLLVGVNQFIGLSFTHSNGRPDSLTARVVARARMTAFSGTGSYLFTDVAPVVSGGRSVLRIEGSATSNILGVTAEIGPDLLPDVRITDPRHFQIDLSLDRAIALIGSGTDLEVSVRTASGNRIKRGKMILTVKKLGVTTGDAYEIWPHPTCTDEVRSCLAGLPAGATDYAACGEAIAVNACGGVSAAIAITDVEIDAATAAADARLADPAGLRSDALALVGAGRADALLAGVRRTATTRLDNLSGTVYPDVASRDAALQAAIDGGFDEGYARPLQFVPALAPLGNDPIRSREIAADGLLAYLTTIDLADTEFGRPLAELTRVYRVQHLASLRYFRLEAVQEVIVGWPPYLFTGDWLGAHVEISVTQATGALSNVYFEID